MWANSQHTRSSRHHRCIQACTNKLRPMAEEYNCPCKASTRKHRFCCTRRLHRSCRGNRDVHRTPCLKGDTRRPTCTRNRHARGRNCLCNASHRCHRRNQWSHRKARFCVINIDRCHRQIPGMSPDKRFNWIRSLGNLQNELTFFAFVFSKQISGFSSLPSIHCLVPSHTSFILMHVRSSHWNSFSGLHFFFFGRFRFSSSFVLFASFSSPTAKVSGQFSSLSSLLSGQSPTPSHSNFFAMHVTLSRHWKYSPMHFLRSVNRS